MQLNPVISFAGQDFSVKGPVRRVRNLSIKPSSFTNNKTSAFFAIISKCLSVKTLFSLLNPPLSDLTVVLCFVPLVLMWWKKLAHTRAYLFIVIYWIANAVENLPYCLGMQSQTQLRFILMYNLLDTPMALLIFYFSSQGKKKQAAMYLFLFFLVLEPLLVMFMGHNLNSSTYIIGAGGVVVLFFSFSGLAAYFNKIEHTPFERAMGFLYAGFILDYGLSIVTIYFSYVNRLHESYDANLFLYYLSLILAIILTSVGFWRHAQRELQRA